MKEEKMEMGEIGFRSAWFRLPRLPTSPSRCGFGEEWRWVGLLTHHHISSNDNHSKKHNPGRGCSDWIIRAHFSFFFVAGRSWVDIFYTVGVFSLGHLHCVAWKSMVRGTSTFEDESSE